MNDISSRQSGAQAAASDSGVTDELFAGLQGILPKHALSTLMYRLTRSKRPWVKRSILNVFLRAYTIDMAQALERDPYAYESFNAFFTRELKPDARPIDSAADSIVSPVDGKVSQCGVIDGDRILQAKGHDYSLIELLAGDTARAKRYQGGTFACIYLAPYNYHRIHMPAAGTLRDTIYVPGDLFSVNAATARAVPRLFARNERVVCDFASPQGDFAMAFIGALFVGSIDTVWAGEINPPPRHRGAPLMISQGRGLMLEKGAEAGRFNMGSTVVLAFEPGCVTWDERTFAPEAIVKMGQRIGTLIGAARVDR
jgi:phosphatidylserine decarboxylase